MLKDKQKYVKIKIIVKFYLFCSRTNGLLNPKTKVIFPSVIVAIDPHFVLNSQIGIVVLHGTLQSFVKLNTSS